MSIDEVDGYDDYFWYPFADLVIGMILEVLHAQICEKFARGALFVIVCFRSELLQARVDPHRLYKILLLLLCQQ